MNDDESNKARSLQEGDTAATAQTSADDEVVGYRRPPVASRFQPGKSGNPSGRPKGKRSVGAIIQEVMNRKVTITQNGKTRRVPAFEALLHSTYNDALRGDKADRKLLLPLFERHADNMEGARQTEDLLREDLEILAKYGKFDQGTAEKPPEGDGAAPDAPPADDEDAS